MDICVPAIESKRIRQGMGRRGVILPHIIANRNQMKMRGEKRQELQQGDDAMRPDLLERAMQCREEMSGFRRERLRNKMFTYGDQWSDRVVMDNLELREDEHMLRQGHVPLKNNLIRRLVRNVLGVFRDRYRLPTCKARDLTEAHKGITMERLLHYNARRNRLGEIYARTMEEFLISGLAVHKKWYGRKGGVTDCWTDIVQNDAFFMDSGGRDVRGWDLSIIGEVHDMPFREVASEFAETEEELRMLERIYGGRLGEPVNGNPQCRIWEVWVREHPVRRHCHDTVTGRCWKMDEADYRRRVEPENRRRQAAGVKQVGSRWFIDEEWRYYFLTSTGRVLRSGRTPYRHGSHPYVFKAYPFVDGEIHSFVSDILDQQKLTNRLISMYDWILQASAKGVLLMPEGALPENVSLDDIADEWSRFDGVIVFKPHAGDPLPQQISSKAVDIGITELLNIQLKMMEDISGVNGALQGKLDSNSMSGTLYNQQTRNSLSALSDLMSSYEDFIRQGTATDASNITQYYSADRMARIAGAGADLSLSRNFNATEFDFEF